MKTVFKWLLGSTLFFIVLVVGIYFGLKRKDIPYDTLEKAYSSPASKFVDLPSGTRAHYRIEGKQDGHTLVLVHGYGVSLETWSAWVSELRNNLRVVSVDWPGHGLTRSPRTYVPSSSGHIDFIEEFANALGLAKFVAIGAGSGGNIVWQFTLRHPARVEALVLVGAHGWPGAERNNPRVVELFSNPKIQPLLVELDLGGMIQNGLNSAFENKALITDAMIIRYSEMLRAPEHRRILSTLMLDRGNAFHATPDVLAAIRVPTLILWGSKDALTPATNAKKFGDAIAGSKVVVYDGIGHMLHEEIPEKSAADLKAFLAKLAVPGVS
jgi:pimeloyl-ACP methyl ester carboxylesterase